MYLINHLLDRNTKIANGKNTKNKQLDINVDCPKPSSTIAGYNL